MNHLEQPALLAHVEPRTALREPKTTRRNVEKDTKFRNFEIGSISRQEFTTLLLVNTGPATVKYPVNRKEVESLKNGEIIVHICRKKNRVGDMQVLETVI